VGRVMREGSERQSHKEEEREGGSLMKRGQGPLAREGELCLNIYAEVPRVPSYATADETGLPT